ncbi:hypothetical protein S245_034036, partial [Arachis hypogaea]
SQISSFKEKYYKFLNDVRLHIPFFEWFHAYSIKNNIEYPFKNKQTSFSANVISTWKVKDGNLVRSEFPPKGAFIISNTEGHNPVMASPFKTKNVDEAVAPKDIKNLIEQSNYTNKFLQFLGDNLSSSGSTFSLKNVSETSTSKSIEKPLFKPFKISSKAKQSLKTSILKQQSSDSEVIQKIDQLLNRFTTIPETPTNSGESTSRIQTRASKAINALGLESNESCSEQSDDSGKSSLKISPILTNSLTKWKGLTKPSTYGYKRVSAPDLALEERELGFVSFNANNVYEWNIDGKTEYNIMSMLQHMTMVGTAYQAAHDTSEEAIANVIVSGFSGQLKGWWDNYLSDNQKYSIFSSIKVNDQNEPIIGDDGEPILDAVNTLIFTIASHFIGDPSLWKDRSPELLSNLRCKTLSDFRWYKDTFLTRVYTREDSQQPFWKEKFLAGLPKSLGDKVRDKIRSLTPDGIIPYDELSYGQLISFIQKVALKICQDDKIQRQLAREKTQNRIDLGTFCEQFGLPACHPKKSKRPSNQKVFKSNPEKNFRRFKKGFQKPKNETGFQKDFQKYPQKNPIICYTCKKPGHVSKYCRLKGKINNLNLDPQIEEQINNLMIESSDDNSGPESSDDNINNIQVDDVESSSDSDIKQINVLSKDQDLLFDAIEAIDNPEQKKDFLLKLKRSLQKEKKPKNLVLNNKYDVKPIFKKLEKQVIHPITIQDLQTEVNNLKREIQEIKRNQNDHHLILSQLVQEEESGDEDLGSLLNQTECSKEQENKISNDNEVKQILRIINVFSFMKHRVNVRIVVKDFVFDTIALFDSGADSNCIREGLVPTKYFEKTIERLCSITGERLSINFKISNVFIEKENIRIPTDFIIAKDIKNDVVLGTPFINLLFPYLADFPGLTSFVGGQ